MKPIKLMISTMKDVDGNTSQGYYGLTADARGRYMIADILFMGETPEEVGASVKKMLTPAPVSSP